MAANNRDPEELRRPCDPIEDRFCVAAVGTDDGVHQGDRATAHRAHVRHIRGDGGHAGRMWILAGKVGRNCLSAHDQVRAAERDDRTIVARPHPESAQQGQIAFRPKARSLAHDDYEMLEGIDVRGHR